MWRSLFLSLTITNLAYAGELPARGGCPSGTVNRGSYCVFTKEQQVIEKDGVCPTGFTGSGAYCVSNGRYRAFKKHSACPGRSQSSGKYCVQKIEERQEN